MVSSEVLQVACDESGAEGENVAMSHHRVLSHGSVDLTIGEAGAVMAELRERTGSRARELKSDAIVSRPHVVEWLLSDAGPLLGRAEIVLVDKQYFLVAKVVDLLIEELAHSRGENLYAGDKARRMAWALFREGKRDLGEELWTEMLQVFNSLMRMKQRKGTKATVDEFFDVVERAHRRSRRRAVSDLLAKVAATRTHADEFQRFIIENPQVSPSLDPLVAAITVTARSWAGRSRRAFELLHDEQAMLTPSCVEETVSTLRRPPREFLLLAPPVQIRDIVLADSRTDERIQVADVVAGVGRWAGLASLEGDYGPAKVVRPFISRESLWADIPTFRVLTGRKEPGG
ncbi:MAG: hypothetical protein JWO11_4397 [Nocardioides sp.]|nr:hypothetical protein [Nocardioides sp.]